MSEAQCHRVVVWTVMFAQLNFEDATCKLQVRQIAFNKPAKPCSGPMAVHQAELPEVPFKLPP
jgi:hypothetical protein